MKVQILFFGATAEAVGEREVEMLFNAGTKSDEAFVEIKDKFPKLKEHSLLFAVNQEYSNSNEIIKNGDELAVFTAVSGG